MSECLRERAGVGVQQGSHVCTPRPTGHLLPRPAACKSPHQTSRQVILHKVLPSDFLPRISEIKVEKSCSDTCPQHGQTAEILVIPGHLPLQGENTTWVTLKESGSLTKMSFHRQGRSRQALHLNPPLPLASMGAASAGKATAAPSALGKSSWPS